MQENKGNNITSAFSFSEEVCFINSSFKSIFLFFPEINARFFLTRKNIQKISLRKIKTARYKSETRYKRNLEGRSRGHKAFLAKKKGIQIKRRLAKRRNHQ